MSKSSENIFAISLHQTTYKLPKKWFLQCSDCPNSVKQDTRVGNITKVSQTTYHDGIRSLKCDRTFRLQNTEVTIGLERIVQERFVTENFKKRTFGFVNNLIFND